MGTLIDLTGKRFGKLTVIGKHSNASRNPWRQTKWLCKCDCGQTTIVQQGNLKTGNTTSCGCYHQEKKIGFRSNKNRLYNSWRGMRARCNNPKNNRFYLYGGRGITVCKEWESFANFKEWAMGNGYRDDLTIDRIDNDKGYSPDNCRWISPYEQSKNRRCVK